MNRGIIVGSDRHQEWLLPWWWENYSAHNDDPVFFIDFGMSKEGKEWCRKRGAYSLFKPIQTKIRGKKEICPSKQRGWEDYYGKKIWSRRRIWFKKPFALLQSPFDWTVWLDLDCQVRKNLDPLFTSLFLGAEICLKRESEPIQRLHREKQFIAPGEVNYDCGLIAYRKEAPILRKWTEEIVLRNQEYVFDQQALSRALAQFPPSLLELTEECNWSAAKGPNPNAMVYHFHGGPLKKMLKEPPPGAFWLS